MMFETLAASFSPFAGALFLRIGRCCMFGFVSVILIYCTGSVRNMGLQLEVVVVATYCRGAVDSIFEFNAYFCCCLLRFFALNCLGFGY